MWGSVPTHPLTDLGIQDTWYFANPGRGPEHSCGSQARQDPLPTFSSLLPVWDKAEVLGSLLRILQFIHCIRERA